MQGTWKGLCWMAQRAGLVVVAAAFLLSGVSCGHQNQDSRSPSYLILEDLTAASGARPDDFGNVLQSDVVTNVKTTVGAQVVYQPTIYEDLGRIKVRMALKEVGSPNAPNLPTAVNTITVTRYHVEFRRSDGRNTPGVDVPYAFDGGASGSADSNGTTITFSIVRAQAKLEAPLVLMRGAGGALLISTIAEVTFYGYDQNGNEVSVTGQISVNFADWGDPVS
jgi:hypothetical protein